MGRLRKPRKAHMYTVHIRVEGRNPLKAETKKTPSQRVSLLRFARLKKRRKSGSFQSRGIHALSQRVIQKLVALQVTLQPPNIQTVRILQAVQPGQLDGEPNFPTLVLALITVQCVDGRKWFTRRSS